MTSSDRIPALPQISGELMLDVFTHRTLVFPGAPTPAHGGSERLAELGARMLDMAVTLYLFSQTELLSVDEIVEQRAQILSDDNFEEWVTLYRLRDKLRYAPDAAEEIKTPEETRALFHAYLGAVYFQTKSPAPIVEWVVHIINPDAEPPSVAGSSSSSYQASSSYQGQRQSSPVQSPSQPHTPTPTPSQPPPYQLPQTAGYGSPPAPTPSSFTLLALFNQTAAQRGMSVSYPAESTGPPHAPRWTVRCVVDGAEKGVGVGRNQKVAKEEAAKQAFQALGWGPGY
ncbi:hypothetical protein PLICRDRAFT_35823 [Plicaturopsis crispa FD-325 SS-3]|nr:hypothetical protein PLICRDRAFT_35823 [Plicaturopsis crispa FD-325 SS-3]